MKAIHAEHVSKAYRRYGRKRTIGTFKSALLAGLGRAALAPDAVFPALTDISFEIEKGETAGIVGPNGSGKSTLLKLLAGILKPTSGRLETRGRVAALIELGAGFHPEISARENIEINAMLLGFPRKEIARRLSAIVEFAGIGDFLDEPVKTFSSGMAVRLGFAIAAHVDPDILLVDEVLSVGDEAFTHRCREKMEEFQRAGKTILIVSHDLGLVASICPRVMRLSRGRLVEDAPAPDVISRYREEVAAEEGRARLATASDSEERWGSGAARLEKVSLRDPSGVETRLLTAGSPFVVRLEGTVAEPLADFVAGVQISRVDGQVVFGSNTAIDRCVIGDVEKNFRVELAFDHADLAAGTYSLDVAVHSENGAPYDYRRGVLRFDVYAPEKISGVWRPARNWTFFKGGR